MHGDFNTTESNMQCCPPPEMVFACRGRMAYDFLPTNWMGLCAPATLIPDVDIIPRDEALLVPSFDYIGGRPKRAIQMIQLLTGLGITVGMATGTAGVDIKAVANPNIDLQQQQDYLADVLKNRQGLDLLTAEKGGICLFLQEKCCFYARVNSLQGEENPWTLSIQEGESVTMNCSYKTSIEALQWYRQDSGKGPAVIILIRSNEKKKQSGRVRVTLNTSTQSSSLSIIAARPEDTAAYFCATEAQCAAGTCSPDTNPQSCFLDPNRG
ncbi:T cell receptor alpha variable 8-1 [Cricetulus griseus]